MFRRLVQNCVLLDACWNVLIKFSKQIANTFMKKIVVTKDSNLKNSKLCQTSEMEFFLQAVTGFKC